MLPRQLWKVGSRPLSQRVLRDKQAIRFGAEAVLATRNLRQGPGKRGNRKLTQRQTTRPERGNQTAGLLAFSSRSENWELTTEARSICRESICGGLAQMRKGSVPNSSRFSRVLPPPATARRFPRFRRNSKPIEDSIGSILSTATVPE